MTQTQGEFNDAKKALQHIAHGTEKVPPQCNLSLEVCIQNEIFLQFIKFFTHNLENDHPFAGLLTS